MTHLRIITYLLLLGILVLTIGCQSYNSGKPSSSQSVAQPVNGIKDIFVHNLYHSVSSKSVPSELGAGRGIGFVRDEDRDTYQLNRPQNDEFRLDVGELFTPWLTIGNGNQESKTFLISAFLDYEQVIFELDGEPSLLHEFTIPARTDMEIPFKLNITESGVHDIIVAIFDQPYNYSLGDDFRMDLHGYVSGKRSQIIVGENTSPARSLSPTSFGNLIPTDITFVPSLVYFASDISSDIHPSRRQLYVAEASSKEPYRFQMVLNNIDPRPLTYALIPLLDYHQIEINDTRVFVPYLDQDQQLVINMELNLSNDTKIHQFQILWLYDPYKSVLLKEVYAPFVFGSPRIALEMQ